MACIAFSVAKPFRKSILSNKPFLLCITVLISMNTLFVFSPDGSAIEEMFDILPFVGPDGTDYYDYRAWLALGILLNSLVTYAMEKTIVTSVTQRADQQ